MTTAEGRLAALAISLLGDGVSIPQTESKLAGGYASVDPQTVAETRAQILDGHDPLGTEFCLLRDRFERRKSGATYTPSVIVDNMLAWAETQGSAPDRIVDAGSGSGRFLVAAAARFPKAKLIGVDLDPLANLMLRANAAVHGFLDRLTIHEVDYREVKIAKIKGRTLFIGNPPYVRHHGISEHWKDWLASSSRAYGFSASKLAGLHIHFFVRTRQLARTGDIGAFITAAEWLDVNYGKLLRDFLADGLGGTSIYLIDPKAQPFVDAMTTGAITCFHVGKRPEKVRLSYVASLEDLNRSASEHEVDWSELSKASKWTPFIYGVNDRPEGFIELGELFRVHRGAVTGKNAVWVENDFTDLVPERFKKPAITKARELMAVAGELASAERLRKVVSLPTELDDLPASDRKKIERFLAWARTQGASDSYVASHRPAWWSVQLPAPAPVLCTYMARKSPTFVLNTVKAVHLNIAHGLYPREALSALLLREIIKYLQTNIDVTSGRTYAGGLVKFEPKELERILIPPLEFFHDKAHNMVNRGSA